jgi:hypothetical protein
MEIIKVLLITKDLFCSKVSGWSGLEKEDKVPGKNLQLQAFRIFSESLFLGTSYK